MAAACQNAGVAPVSESFFLLSLLAIASVMPRSAESLIVGGGMNRTPACSAWCFASAILALPSSDFWAMTALRRFTSSSVPAATYSPMAMSSR